MKVDGRSRTLVATELVRRNCAQSVLGVLVEWTRLDAHRQRSRKDLLSAAVRQLGVRTVGQLNEQRLHVLSGNVPPRFALRSGELRDEERGRRAVACTRRHYDDGIAELLDLVQLVVCEAVA